MGTANIVTPVDPRTKALHGVVDVLPHVLLGTHPQKDPTTIPERLLGLINPKWGYKGDVKLTKGERAESDRKRAQDARREARDRHKNRDQSE